MGTLPSNPSHSDAAISALTIVCPLICGRLFSAEEIAYIYSRLDSIRSDLLLEAIEHVGDTEARIGNPIAAIRERVAIYVREEREARKGRLLEEEQDALPSLERRRELAAETRAALNKITSKMP